MVIKRGYDSAGNRDSAEFWVGGNLDVSYGYQHDALNRVAELQQVGRERYEFSYLADDQLDLIGRYHTASDSFPFAESDYGYDSVGQLTSLVHSGPAAAGLASYDWRYDALGRIEHVQNADTSVTYTYDATGQLTGADYAVESGIADEIYNYDANGNRTDAGNTPSPWNRLAEDSLYRYLYDGEGNRTRRTEKASGAYEVYDWDYRNRLSGVRRYSAADTLEWNVEYGYDYQNRLVARGTASG